MDFTQLKNFQAVARYGNVTRAAREMYISQPSLSKSIARLEEELGVPLFSHRKGKIELNDYGRIFLENVETAFAELSEGAQNIKKLYETNQNILSLTSNIAGYLPDVLPAFCRQHQELGIRQQDSTTQEMIDLLLSRTVSLGISCETIHHESIIFDELGHKEYVLAVHQDNPITKTDAVRIEELRDQTFICDTTRMRMEPLRRLCLQEGFSPKVGYEIENSNLIFNLVEDNRGVAILPIGLCCQMMYNHPNHHLRIVRIDADLEPIIIGIAYHKDFEFSEAAKMFKNFVLQNLEDEERLIRRMGYDFLN